MIEIPPHTLMDRISLAISRVAMWLTALIVAIIAFEVVMRYFFMKPTIWVSEMSLWVGGMIYLFAGLYVMQQRGHIRITLLYDASPHWLRKVFDVTSTALICVFSASIVYGGFDEAWTKLLRWERFGTAWDPPIPATMKPAIMVIAVLIALQAIANLIADWNKAPEKASVPDDLVDSYVETVRDRHD